MQGYYDKPPVEIATDDITKASSILKLVNLTIDDYAFDVDRYKRLWNVTFQLYDNVIYQYQVINGHTSTIPNTSRTGYDFIRWVANGNTWNTTSSIEDNMVITAEYQIKSFNISVDANGGSNSSNTTMEYMSQLSQPTSSRTNNNIDGWYYVASYENHSAGEKVTFPVTITGDLSIKAEWNVTVTYKVKSNTYTTRTIRSGTTASNISYSANGYTFNYWYSTNSSQQFDFETIVSQHLTLNANVTPIPYNITYVLNNGTNDSRNRTSYTIEDSFYIYPATRSGYYFEGWYGGGLSSTTQQPYISASYGNKTFTADFRAYYTVTFNSNGGSSVSSQQIASGHCATQPSNPTQEGYDFNYWMLSGSRFYFSTAITSNITLVASWSIKQLTVTFNKDGPVTESSITKNYGSYISSSDFPTTSDSGSNSYGNITSNGWVIRAWPYNCMTSNYPYPITENLDWFRLYEISPRIDCPFSDTIGDVSRGSYVHTDDNGKSYISLHFDSNGRSPSSGDKIYINTYYSPCLYISYVSFIAEGKANSLNTYIDYGYKDTFKPVKGYDYSTRRTWYFDRYDTNVLSSSATINFRESLFLWNIVINLVYINY